MANSAQASGPRPVTTKLNAAVEAIEALETCQSEFKASSKKSLQYLQLKIDVQNETIQEQVAQIKFLEEVLQLEPEIDEGGEEIQ